MISRIAEPNRYSEASTRDLVQSVQAARLGSRDPRSRFGRLLAATAVWTDLRRRCSGNDERFTRVVEDILTAARLAPSVVMANSATPKKKAASADRIIRAADQLADLIQVDLLELSEQAWYDRLWLELVDPVVIETIVGGPATVEPPQMGYLLVALLREFSKLPRPDYPPAKDGRPGSRLTEPRLFARRVAASLRSALGRPHVDLVARIVGSYFDKQFDDDTVRGFLRGTSKS